MHKPRGFTIVELLIVIVVIGILAAITVVAYNGIQTRAKNAMTINATTSWIKALKLYNAKEDSWPTANSCLGSLTTYQGSNSQCYNSAAWVVSSSFLTQMQPYISNYPEPDTTDVTNGGANTPRRGALYYISGADRLIFMMLPAVSSCPDIMGLPSTTNNGLEAGGMRCTYKIN